MNRLSKWVLGSALALMMIIVSACSSGNSGESAQTPQQPTTNNESTGTTETPGTDNTGTDATGGGAGGMDNSTGTDNQGSTEDNTGSNESGTGTTPGTGNSGSGNTNGGSEVNNNADPELTPQTTELKISTVQQGPGQMFLRVESLPQGYGVSQMEWESKGYTESATFDQAVQNGKNGKDGFYASSDQRNFGFIYNQSHSGQTGKITLTLSNASGDELTWYDDVTLQ
ncbi:hypothetical protein [Paenibacillus sp. WLX2291]|uniref:hypothetical protein n=1 Tax=Paenibacillus sp. WLX2291 TaxID=3296934 RepID=UPI003983EDD2